MTLFLHEIKESRIALAIWTGIISFMLAICILIYPEMGAQMENIGDVFADMGSFTAAFGMDSINFGEFLGFFAIECGNVLGLGGAFFAGIIGINSIFADEKEGYAEFLLSHPISRKSILLSKLFSIIFQITVLNITVWAVTAISVLIIGEKPDIMTIVLVFLAYYLLQLELAFITFGISAFIRKGGMGIGLGISFGLYFLNILANLTEEAKFLKYITPFAYADGAAIVSEKTIEQPYLFVGAIFSAIGIAAAFIKYSKKDIL